MRTPDRQARCLTFSVSMVARSGVVRASVAILQAVIGEVPNRR